MGSAYSDSLRGTRADGLWEAARERADKILDCDLMRDELVDAAWDLAILFRDLYRRRP